MFQKTTFPFKWKTLNRKLISKKESYWTPIFCSSKMEDTPFIEGYVNAVTFQGEALEITLEEIIKHDIDIGQEEEDEEEAIKEDIGEVIIEEDEGESEEKYGATNDEKTSEKANEKALEGANEKTQGEDKDRKEQYQNEDNDYIIPLKTAKDFEKYLRVSRMNARRSIDVSSKVFVTAAMLWTV